jgi:hypothetical protein
VSDRIHKTQSNAVGKQTLLILHVINLAALLTLSVILLFAATVRPFQAIVVLPVLVLGVFYWQFREKQNVVACYFGLSLSVLVWIVLCENIVRIDNLLGTQITRRLPLGYELQVHVDRINFGRARLYRLEPCCGDVTSFRYPPGSRVRGNFDCETCNESYDRVADETGFLNRRRGLWASSKQIDLFLAGDSAMQGIGLPSVLEFIEQRIPLTMWNLSIAGYGPREKVNALLTYALPRQPRWIIIEFYSANDPSDALTNEACEGVGDFRCRFSDAEIRRQLLLHPTYAAVFSGSAPQSGMFDSYIENSLTLAVTRYFIDAVKGWAKESLLTTKRSQTSAHNRGAGEGVKVSYAGEGALFPIGNVSHPGEGRLFPIGRLNYVKIGMEVLLKNYERLVMEVSRTRHQPGIILLYNPSCYEVYRDILLELDPGYDQISQFQLESLRAFSEKSGWKFLDLTVMLRKKLAENKMWIYGRYDTHHWSLEGTAFVAEVLSDELLRIIKEKEVKFSPGRLN